MLPTQQFSRLAHRRIGNAVVRAKLDDRPRPQNIDEPEREWHVFDPSGGRQTLGRPEHRSANDARENILLDHIDRAALRFPTIG